MGPGSPGPWPKGSCCNINLPGSRLQNNLSIAIPTRKGGSYVLSELWQGNQLQRPVLPILRESVGETRSYPPGEERSARPVSIPSGSVSYTHLTLPTN